MNKKTTRALLKSIAHWHDNYHMDKLGGSISYSSNSCALCQRFGDTCTISESFEQCPVMAATGKDGCVATPYFDVMDALVDGHPLLPPILDEIGFLVDLLPEPD
jgi:hypothetical protein